MSIVSTPLPLALRAATLCEAFVRTAAERPDDVALRTPRDTTVITWSGVRRARGADRGRPARPRRPARRHGRADAAQPARVPPRRHGGPPRGRDPVLALQHELARAGGRDLRQRAARRRGHGARAAAARRRGRARPAVRPPRRARRRPRSQRALARGASRSAAAAASTCAPPPAPRSRATSRRSSTPRARAARRRASSSPTRNLLAAARAAQERLEVTPGRPARLLPPGRAHRRPLAEPLPRLARPRLHRHVRGRPAPGARRAARRAADAVGRRAAGAGEAPRRADAPRRRRPGRADDRGADRAAREARAGRAALARGRGGAGLRAGARVLRPARHPRRRDVGDVGDRRARDSPTRRARSATAPAASPSTGWSCGSRPTASCSSAGR